MTEKSEKNSNKKKIKIRTLPPKIREISEAKNEESELEEEIEESEAEQLANFISSGKISAPVLESSEPQQTIPETRARQTQSSDEDMRSDTTTSRVSYVSPQISFSSESSQNPQQSYDPSTFQERTILRSSENSPGFLRRPTFFQNEELERLRGESRDKEYDEKIKSEDTRTRRRMPWEV